MRKAMVINRDDNVAVALTNIKPGEKVLIKVGDSEIEITTRSAIPLGHKFAIKRITKGGKVIKYGEAIGRATDDIEVGEYVHVHNVESLKGRKDLRTR